jgi:iron complex outermembrane receptor protein
MVIRRRDAYRCTWTLVVAIVGVFGAVPSATAQNLGTVTGSVVDAADRAPLIGAKVTFEKLDEPTGVRGTRTATGGTFQFERVQPGRYVLEVSYLGYQERQVPMTLEIGESRDLDLVLQLETFSLETTVEAPFRQRQRLLEAPASVSVLEPTRIRREAMTSSVEALRAAGGVDVAQTGVDRRVVALRGFNNAFSDAPHVRTDHRESDAPVLGLNLYSVMPNTTLDLDRIEAVRGPAGALYGLDVDGGVLHFVTKDPFQDPGTSLSVSGGSRSYVNAQFRQAGVLGDNVGYKFTGQWSRADEWPLDPSNAQDAAEIARYRVYETRDAVPAGREVSEIDRDADGEAAVRLRREDLYRRYNVNGLLTYRFDHDTALDLRGGYASLTSPLQSPIGTLQASEFGSTYGQLRLDAGEFSAQASLSRNLSQNETYLLRTGERITDEGTEVDGGLQYVFRGGPLDTEVLVGGEADVTHLQTEPGTTAPDEKNFSTFGTYLQATTPLAPSWTLTLTGRTDYFSVQDEVYLFPRAALVYTPSSQHALRASYNRSVSAPAASPLLQVAPETPAPPQSTVTQTLEVGYKGQVGTRGHGSVDLYYETRDHVFVPVGIPVQYRNAGNIDYWGLDVAAEVTATDKLTIFGNTSVVSEDSFDGDRREVVALNAPGLKTTGGIDYGHPRGLTLGATVHHVDDFPVRFGPYAGTVDSYTLLDVRARSTIPSIPGLIVNLTAKNVLGNDHREFVGAPALGRMVIARLTYTL